jgi:hypothetical protein
LAALVGEYARHAGILTDEKFTQSFRAIITSGKVEPLALPARSPNLNAYAERWVRSVKEECLSKVILFGERSLRRALSEYVDHYHEERNHQGKGNVLLFPRNRHLDRERRVNLVKYLQKSMLSVQTSLEIARFSCGHFIMRQRLFV